MNFSATPQVLRYIIIVLYVCHTLHFVFIMFVVVSIALLYYNMLFTIEMVIYDYERNFMFFGLPLILPLICYYNILYNKFVSLSLIFQLIRLWEIRMDP